MTGAGFPGELLPGAARAAIAERLGVGRRGSRDGLDDRFFEPGASFVTLTLEGALRGCVGSLQADRPLLEDVEANAAAAAFEDHRFAPLPVDELERILVEVSVLSPLTRLPVADEGELLATLEPGVDGLVLVTGARRATFLPQVWESLPRPRDFVSQLRRKAGLGDDYWNLGPSFFRYHVRKWRESSRR